MKTSHPFLHLKKQHSYLFSMILSCVPLIGYGIYKNGFLPFWKLDAPLLNIFTPILFISIGFLIGGLVDYFHCLRKKEKVKWNNTPLYGLLISMAMPIQMNLIIYAIILFLGLFLFCYLEEKSKKIKISPLLFTQMILMIIIFSFKIPYENISEQTQIHIYTTLDLFFGRNIGGLASTSIFWMMIVFIFFWFNDYYKKEIPIILLTTYAICALFSELIIPTGNVVKQLLNPTVFFSSLYFASDISYSPYTLYGKWVYAIALGIIGFFTVRFFRSEGIYFSVALLSLLVPILDFVSYKIEKKTGSFVELKKAKRKKREINQVQKIELPKKRTENE